jgi:probable HAF family extracellular repeat protein
LIGAHFAAPLCSSRAPVGTQPERKNKMNTSFMVRSLNQFRARGKTTTQIVLTLIAVCGFFPSETQAEKVQRYIVIDLGQAGVDSRAESVNARGQIVGNNGSHGAYWAGTNSAPLDLGTLGSGNTTNSAASAINNRAQIVGVAFSDDFSRVRAVFWANSNSLPMDLGTLGGETSAADALNQRGSIVGQADTSNGLTRAAFWANGGAPAVMLADLGGDFSQALGINEPGRIVGDGSDTSGNFQALFWVGSNAAPVSLATLGGDFTNTFAGAISENGQIVGAATTADFSVSHAVSWDKSTEPAVDLGALSGGLSNSEALAVNNRGDVVGDAFNEEGSVNHAVLWSDATSPAVDLNTRIPANSGWVLEVATGINDAGVIVGHGIINGDSHAFALLPMAR